MAIFGESYILYFHHNISNLRSSRRFHRVRKKRDSTVQNNPPTIKKKNIYLILKNVVEDATFHIIILLLQIFKTKNFPFLPYEGNDPLLEQA